LILVYRENISASLIELLKNIYKLYFWIVSLFGVDRDWDK